jgi:hypothetical protein
VNEFADAIGLCSQWPLETEDNEEAGISGLLTWAHAYFSAAELLHFSKKTEDFAFYSGPIVHNVGLATELTLKAILRGMGKTSKEIRKYSHNTYEAYYAARECFDEVKFMNLHFSNTKHLSIPEEVRTRLTAQGDEDVETRWRVYFDHLRILDTVYDRPYSTRYMTPGPVTLPDTDIILIGTKLLLTAIEERLE